MATITAFGATLKVIGTDVVQDDNSLNRAGLKAALFSDVCPVGNLAGKVDFVVCFVNQGPQPGSFCGTDHGQQPRPLRGIIYLADSLESLSLERLGHLLGGGVGHELGHYWLAPGGAKVRVGNADVDTPTAEEIAQALNQGLDCPPYPIIGRDDRHWSPFIDGGSSPMEAANLGAPNRTRGVGPMELFGRYDQVVGEDKTGPTVVLPSGDQVQTHSRFCAFERWLMGALHVGAPVGALIRWPSFLVLVPNWSFPFEFQSGLYVRLVSGKTWYVGFHGGPHEVCAHEISEPAPTQTVSLGSDPLDPYVRVGARVVRRGASVDLQVRLWAPGPRFLTPARPFSERSSGGRRSPISFWRVPANPSAEDVMGDVASGAVGAADAWSGWRTIVSTTGQIDRMGLSSRTLGNRRMYTLMSATVYLHQAGVTTPVDIGGLQQDFPAAGPALLPSGQLMMPYLLADGSIVRYEEKATSRSAPKLLASVPTGDFAFGGILSLDRCIQEPWAGGLGAGKKMVGRAEWVKWNRLTLSGTAADRAIRTGAPHGGAYKVLFCVAARTDTITAEMVSNLDLVRRAWEIYSPLLMGRGRDSSTAVF